MMISLRNNIYKSASAVCTQEQADLVDDVYEAACKNDVVKVNSILTKNSKDMIFLRLIAVQGFAFVGHVMSVDQFIVIAKHPNCGSRNDDERWRARVHAVMGYATGYADHPCNTVEAMRQIKEIGSSIYCDIYKGILEGLECRGVKIDSNEHVQLNTPPDEAITMFEKLFAQLSGNRLRPA